MAEPEKVAEQYKPKCPACGTQNKFFGEVIFWKTGKIVFKFICKRCHGKVTETIEYSELIAKLFNLNYDPEPNKYLQ